MEDSEQFSENARRKIVVEVLSGTMTKEQARRVYGIRSKSAILEWMRILAGLPRNAAVDPIPLLKDMSGEKDKIKELKARIKELEEELKISRLKGRSYQIMVGIAKEDYGLDLGKKAWCQTVRRLKEEEPKVSLEQLCGLSGNSRQAYYKSLKHVTQEAFQEELVLGLVAGIRRKSKTSRWGVRKLHRLLRGDLTLLGIKMGRDKLFDLLRANGLLVSKRKRKLFTTQSHHWLRKYQNLVQDMVVSRPSQLWVSDITYVQFNGEVYYLYLITDAYSQKIVGWNLTQDLKAESALEALKTALSSEKNIPPYSLMHHSDRGIQYCSCGYTGLLEKSKIWISMTRPASPHENAIAERVNGVLKEEWLVDLENRRNINAKKCIDRIINIYNRMRPHNGLGNVTPVQVHDEGFIRHDAERVIGKKYHWIKKTESVKM